MKKYKIVGSSKPEFMDMTMNLTFDDISLGKNCEVFGFQFTITQTGKVLVLANPDWVLTLQELPPPSVTEIWDGVIVNPKHLRINHEVDVFLASKHIKLHPTDRLTIDNGVTLLCLFKFLKNEWKFIERASGTAFPFEYDPEHKLFIMRNEWDFQDLESITLFREGSYSRYSIDGRCI